MDTTASTPLSRSHSWTDWLALRWQRVDFRFRATGLQLLRTLRNAQATMWLGPFPRLEAARRVDEAAGRMAFVRATHVSRLWTHEDAREWRLTAGKVHNLRVAARSLDGLVLPANTVFSFWGAVGRPSTWRGFVPGRELREGCLIASTGGGLCQLSNALYAVALQSGAQIVERHAHSRVVPGSQAAHDRDATVFWNYLDLRFRLAEPCELEVRLDEDRLVVNLRTLSPHRPRVPGTPVVSSRASAAVAHDCAGCTRTACPDRVVPAPGQGVLRAAVPQAWPEHLAFARDRVQAARHLVVAEDVTGWRVQASRILAWLWRRQPAARRRAVLAVHDARARAWAKTLGAADTELIVPLDWLAALACDGALQGRRYSVLMTRPPLSMLHRRLDEAGASLPLASLHDFRASPARVAAEWQALQGAACLVTPHAELADALRAHVKVDLLQPAWQPVPAVATTPMGRRVLFPASSLARMGAVELRSACRALGCGLDVLGAAEEDAAFWHGLDVRRADPNDPWRDIGLVVLPAWVETAPRWLLQAMARGVPVVATPACGLPAEVPGWRAVSAGDAAALTLAMSNVLSGYPGALPIRRPPRGCSGTPRRASSSRR